MDLTRLMILLAVVYSLLVGFCYFCSVCCFHPVLEAACLAKADFVVCTICVFPEIWQQVVARVSSGWLADGQKTVDFLLRCDSTNLETMRLVFVHSPLVDGLNALE